LQLPAMPTFENGYLPIDADFGLAARLSPV
jgi:hypothetical protein